MPATIKRYIYFISAVGIAILLYSLFSFEYSSIIILLILGVIGGLLEKYLISLPNGTYFSGTLAFTFIPLIYYGVEEAVIVEFLVFVVSTIFTKRVNLKDIYNVNQYILCIFLAGVFYEWGMGDSVHFEWKSFIFIFFGIVIHTTTNAILLSVIFSKLQGKSYWETCLNIIKDSKYVYLFTTILSFLLDYVYGKDDMVLFFMVSGFVALSYFGIRYAFNLFINMRRIYITSIEMLSDIKETKLLINRGHSTRVGQFARKIAEELKLPQEEIDEIHYAALFHDMGKLSLEEEIFQKRGALSIEEEKEYRKHVELGSDMIKEISGLDKAAEYVLHHHERWDGKGFPKKLTGEQIPLGARIIALANEIDHLTYDPRIKSPQAEFMKMSGTKLDPELVRVYEKIFEEFHVTKEAKGDSVDKLPNMEEVKDIIPESNMKLDLQHSKVISNIGIFQVTFTEGVYKDPNGQEITVREELRLKELMEKAKTESSGVRDYIEDRLTGNIYDSYCWSFNNSFHFIFVEITNLIAYEKNQEEQINKLYRDVMFSVTEGKFTLLNQDELESIKNQEILGKSLIQTRADVPLCRQIVQELLTQMNVPGKVSFQILLCTSEVVTNVLKHADSGEMNLVYKEGKLQIIVEDNGSGINLSELPKSALLSGYSTKVSMGQGFSLILKMMDAVKVFTSELGTTVVLEVNLEEKIAINSTTKDVC